jgi:NlpC/P60 family putative phage cell wall peptidase
MSSPSPVAGAGCDCLGLLRGVWREWHGEEPETTPPYSPDWAEATGEETLYRALASHLTPISRSALAAGDIALFRMAWTGPAKHCGVVAGETARLTLIHARQNKRVSEEVFSAFWRRRLAYAFRV